MTTVAIKDAHPSQPLATTLASIATLQTLAGLVEAPGVLILAPLRPLRHPLRALLQHHQHRALCTAPQLQT